MCSTMSLSVMWKSCFNLAWVQHLWSRANRCLLSKASLCCILFYNEDIPYFLHVKSATSAVSKWSTENSFALNRDPPWQTFVHHLGTTSRAASYGTLESVHYSSWHCSLSFSQTMLFDQIPIKRNFEEKLWKYLLTVRFLTIPSESTVKKKRWINIHSSSKRSKASQEKFQHAFCL